MTPDGKNDWSQRFRGSLPTRESLCAHPWLRPIASRLTDPQLWRLQNESVAKGLAIGLFWAFLIPIAQIVVATAHCVWWRGNIPVAAGVTLVTNPLTIGFWLWLAYQVGGAVLGPTAMPEAMDVGWLHEYGWPTMLGMGMFAVGASMLGYTGVKCFGWLRLNLKRRQRRNQLLAGFRVSK